MPAPKPGRPVARSASNRVAPLPPTQLQQQRAQRFNVGAGQQQHAPTQKPVCTLNLHLPDLDSTVNSEMGDATLSEEKHAELIRNFGALNSLDVSSSSSSFPPTATLMQRAELKLSDIAECLRQDWINLAVQLGLTDQDVLDVQKEYRESVAEQALGSLHLWYETMGNKATGNVLEKALKKIGR